MTGEVQSDGSEGSHKAHTRASSEASEGVAKAMLARVLKPWAARAAATEGGAFQDARSVCNTADHRTPRPWYLAAGENLARLRG